MGKGGDDAPDGAPSSALPRGVMLHNYGTAAADTVSSRGAVASAGKRNFSVREGETVELLDLNVSNKDGQQQAYTHTHTHTHTHIHAYIYM